MREIISESTEQTEKVGEEFSSSLKGTEIIALFGGLGMGKTAFVRGLARGLGFPCGVSSPTFAIVNEYRAEYPIYHFDMYRVNSWDDLYSTGFFDYLGNGILIIEWSENIENALPEEAVKISFSRGDNENTRVIRFEQPF